MRYNPVLPIPRSERPQVARRNIIDLILNARSAAELRQYGWVMTKELGDGRKRWKGTEEHKGQYRTQKIEPGTRVKSSGDNRRSIGEHIDTLLESPESFTPEHRADLRAKLLTLTRDQFAALRAQFGIRKKGRRKEEEVNTLLEGVEEKKKPKVDERAQRNRQGLGQAPKVEKASKESGVKYVRAKPGGETSPVDGRFYKGGQLMPVHGMYSGMEKVKGSGKQASTPVTPNPDARGKDRQPAQPMSPEMIEQKRQEVARRKAWEEIKQSPLGRMKFLGDSPSQKVITDGRTNLKDWIEFAKELGPDRLASLVSSLESALPEKDRDYIKEESRDQAGIDVTMTPAARKHDREIPNSLYARQLLQAVLGESKSLEGMQKAAQILSAAAGPPETGPQEGDTNAEGLVFRDGQWRREDGGEKTARIPLNAPEDGSRISAQPSSEQGGKKQEGGTMTEKQRQFVGDLVEQFRNRSLPLYRQFTTPPTPAQQAAEEKMGGSWAIRLAVRKFIDDRLPEAVAQAETGEPQRASELIDALRSQNHTQLLKLLGFEPGKMPQYIDAIQPMLDDYLRRHADAYGDTGPTRNEKVQTLNRDMLLHQAGLEARDRRSKSQS